jgi:WhiB family redox-sensing transcriptional regulator
VTVLLAELLAQQGNVELERAALAELLSEHSRLVVALLAAVREHQAGDWRHEAACRAHPIETFFGRRRLAAIQVCRSCPVLEDCRDWALGLPEHADPAGVLGGMSATERRERRLRSAPAGGAMTESAVPAPRTFVPPPEPVLGPEAEFERPLRATT